MKHYEIHIPIMNPDSEAMLIVALVQQGFQVYKSADDIVSTIMGEGEVIEIELPFQEDLAVQTPDDNKSSH